MTTDNANPSSRNPLNHRENQRERILEVAEALFVRDGIDKVNLSAIAHAARTSTSLWYPQPSGLCSPVLACSEV